VQPDTGRDQLSSAITERYQRVLAQITEAKAASIEPARPIRLIVVSKGQSLELIQAAIAAGIATFGENYVDEAMEKIATLHGSGVEWHMIGHVQSRKAEAVAQLFSTLHSLDSLKLARRLDRFCEEAGRTLLVLLEMNVSGEASKFGFPAWDEARWPDLLPELRQIAGLTHLKVNGLMTMPPFFSEPEAARPYFRKLRNLRGFLRIELPQTDWSELSMGTSHDFQTAVQEGATYVRIGEAILGPRPKKTIP
jgi:pyridoxal phosphate enzyme (YggS family)